MPDPTPPAVVSVCACTFRRPALLGELLDALAGQRLAPPFEVVVVDNDGAATAGPAIAAARARYPSLRLRSAVEPRQNIALARNHAVALARGRFIAFVDDDERPEPRWLSALTRALERFGADGVVGPVLSELPPDAPSWIVRGRFFDRPRHASGDPVPEGELRTGNLLLGRDLLGLGRPAPDEGSGEGQVLGGVASRAEGLRDPGAPHLTPFDARYGLTGGEDSALLIELHRRGARFVWCDDAVVRERVSEERARLGFLLRRAFGGGCGHARWRLDREGPRALPTLLVRASGALWLSSLLAPLSLPLGRHHAAAWGRLGAAGIGKLAGIAGLRYQPYRVTSG